MTTAWVPATLTLGGLDLNTRTYTDGYRFRVLADGFAPGSPEAVKSVVASILLDGDDERILRVGNTKPQFKVQVEGEGGDLRATRRGARTLARVCARQRVELKMRLDKLTEMTVYDTVTIDPAAEQFNDVEQVMRARQTWQLNLTCLPWARPENPTVVVVNNAGTTAGLLTIPVGGSQRTTATVKVEGGVSSNTLYLYTDPTMATNGWVPDIPTTWPNAPGGPEHLYTVWVAGSIGGLGTWVEVDIIGTPGVTQTLGFRDGPTVSGVPYRAAGNATLGGVQDATLGAVAGPLTFAVRVNGTTQSPANYTLMLTRVHPDASFSMVRADAPATSVTFQPPSLTSPRGGIFFTGSYPGSVTSYDATDRARKFAYPKLLPTQSLIWFTTLPGSPTGASGYKVTTTFFERHVGWVAA